MSNREHIPAALERDLMIESGYRCAICKTPEPLEIDHIDEYSKVREHKFENMIVLCGNCHSRKTNRASPRKIDHIALKKIKQDMMLLNGRYSSIEKRLLQMFSECPLEKQALPNVELTEKDIISIMYLIRDGYVKVTIIEVPFILHIDAGRKINHNIAIVSLTESGRKFVMGLSLYKYSGEKHD